MFNFLKRVAQGDEKPGGGAFGFLRDRAQENVNAVRTVKDFTLTAARETAKFPQNVVNSVLTAGERAGSGRVEQTLADLRALKEEERKKKVAENEGLRVLLEGRGITDLSDKGLDEAKKNVQARAKANEANTEKADNPLAKVAYGGKPVESYQKRREGYEKDLGKSRFRDVATPLSFLGAGLTIATDPVGGGKKNVAKGIAEEVAERLAKETTESGVKKILTKVAPGISDDVAGAIAMTKDKQVIGRLLTKEGGKAARVVDTVSGGKVGGSAYSTTDVGFAKQFADETTDGAITPKAINLSETLDTRIPEHRTALESVLGKDKVEKLIGRTDNGLPNHSLQGEQDELLNATKGLGYKNIALSETDKTTKFNGRDVISYASVDDAPQVNKAVDEVVDSYADTLKSMDDGMKGGQMIPDVGGGYKRISEHTPFYSRYYAEFGRPPSKAAYREEALAQLKAGKADTAFQPAYDDAVNPEVQSLLQAADQGQLSTTQPVGQVAQQPEVPSMVPPNNVTPPPTDIKTATIPTGGRSRKRGFIKTVKESPTSTAETKKAVSELEENYFIKPNPETLAKVKPGVDSDPEGTLARLFTTERFNDEDVVAAELLLGRAQQAGNREQAKRITDFLSDQLLQSGRTSQAASIWKRLSPQGVLLLAARKSRKAREAITSAKGIDEKKVANELKQMVDNGTPVTKSNIDKTIDDIINGADEVAEELSTGQKVAKRVEATVKPKVKKKADILVNEITKKIKQEQMVPLPKKDKKTSVEILREVFGRNKEAQEAFPEAQRILRSKFADNPKALKILDKFFASELGLPSASTTIDRAIKEQLGKSSTRVSDIIYKSWANQKQSVEDISQALVKEGFDEGSAKTLAKEVTDRLNKQMTEAKASTLARLSQEAPKKARATYEEKIAKLSNLGALDDTDYLDLARGKLKLPNLSSKLSGELSELAQEMQKYGPNDPKRYRIIEEISEKINKSIDPTKKEIAVQVAGAPRALMASTDISGMGRQGIMLGTRFPKEYKEGFKAQVEFLSSPEKFKQGMAEIAADKDFKIINDDMGVALTGVTKSPEEIFESTVLENDLAKKMGIGHVVGASNRGYTGGLTKFRFDTAKKIIGDLRAAGIDVENMPKKHLESLGYFINVASGRGGKPGGWLEKHSVSLSSGLFSPRLWASRLAPLNPKYYYDLKGPARKYALESAGSFAAVAGTVLGLATLAGAEVETDARSSDFLKIKVGDSRYDVLGGFQQNLVFAHRFLTGEKKSSTTGDVQKLGEGFGASTRLTIIADLVQNKANPLISAGGRIIAGKDRGGQPTSLSKEARNLVTPLSVADTIDQVKKKGLVKGILGSAPGYLGIGSQTYGVEDNAVTERQRAYIDQLKETGAPKGQVEATERFYQTMKNAPSRELASKKINDALAKNDIEGARQITAEYNKKYVDTFKKWSTEYGSYGEDETLFKDFSKQLIKLSNQSIKTRVRNINENPLYRATRGQQ